MQSAIQPRRRWSAVLSIAAVLLACAGAPGVEPDGPPLANPRDLRFEPIDSQHFVGIHYDSELRRLTVALIGGIIRTHLNVPPEVVEEFRTCRLKGGFYKGRILHKFIAAEDQILRGPVPMARAP